MTETRITANINTNILLVCTKELYYAAASCMVFFGEGVSTSLGGSWPWDFFKLEK